MKINEAAAFEQDFYQAEKGLGVRSVLKPKRNRFINGGDGSNIRPAIPGGVHVTTITPRDNAKAWTKAENREAWQAKRTYLGYQHGWVLLEDDSEDSVEIVHPTTCDCCETDQDALNLLLNENDPERTRTKQEEQDEREYLLDEWGDIVDKFENTRGEEE